MKIHLILSHNFEHSQHTKSPPHTLLKSGQQLAGAVGVSVGPTGTTLMATNFIILLFFPFLHPFFHLIFFSPQSRAFLIEGVLEAKKLIGAPRNIEQF